MISYLLRILPHILHSNLRHHPDPILNVPRNIDSSEPDNVTFSSTSPTSSAHSSLSRCFTPSLEQSTVALDVKFLIPPKCQRSKKVQFSTDIMSTSLIHIYKPTILDGKFNVFDADKKTLLYTAKKNKASSTPAMDIYRGDNLIMPIGSVAIPKARHYPKFVNMQMSSRSVELTNNTPFSYCIHSFVSDSGTLIWKSRDDGFKDCGAVHGEHGLVLMSERNIQLAEFHPSQSFWGRKTGMLEIINSKCGKDLRDEIVISFIALRRFTCFCCSHLSGCGSPAMKTLWHDYTD